MAGSNGFNAELFFSALADKTRLRLLNLLRDGEVCVCFFAGTLDTNNPKISRHLSYLKRARLVKGRRDGKWVHYSITEPADEKAKAVFHAMMEMLAADKEMQNDRKRFAAACCQLDTPLSIQRRAVITT